MSYFTPRPTDTFNTHSLQTGIAPVGCTPLERKVTEKEKVEIWFIDPLLKLKGDDGFTCLLICFPLIEAIVRYEIGVPDNVEFTFSDNSPALKWFSGFMTIPEAKGREVWDALRNGLMHRGKPVLRFLASIGGREPRLYALDESLTLRSVDNPETATWMKIHAAIPAGVLTSDRASVIYKDARGTWRLPRGDASFERELGVGRERVCREVCTERNLFNAHGTIYELPAENAGGFAKIRPVATHNRHIQDYASYRGLLVMSGLRADAPADDPHVVRSTDGKCALWAGNVEDLWKLGKPRGTGGPWKDSIVTANVPSDPYLMTGYDRKSLHLTHDSTREVTFTLELDITGEGCWVTQERLKVAPGATIDRRLPDALCAYWSRLTSDIACHATAIFNYE